MCGRFTNTAERTDLVERFAASLPEGFRRRYNIAPTQGVVAVRRDPETTDRTASLMRWGLLPRWAKDASISYKLINARAETLTEKPAFRGLVRKHRCLIPADGFYEWQRQPDGTKQPIRYTLADGRLFAFAGLWTSRDDPDTGEPLESCTIVTTAANELVAPAHDRMPVILDPAVEADWLDPETPLEHALALLQPCPAGWMLARPVSRRVGSVRNDDPELLVPDPAELRPSG